MRLWAIYWEKVILTMWSCAFLSNVISGIISTLQLWRDRSVLRTEAPQVAWEENSRVDTSRHGIQTWQLEHFLGPTSPGPDLSAGLLGRESRQGSQCRESSVSPRNSSVWAKYFSPLPQIFPPDLSMFGVREVGCPETERSPKPRSSASKMMTLGLAGI